MVLYGITLVSLSKELRAADLCLLYPFYADDVVFNGLEQQSAQLLKMLMESGSDQGYFPELAKSLFILDTQGSKRGGEKGIYRRGANLELCYWY